MHEEMSLWDGKQRTPIVIDMLTITKSNVHFTDTQAKIVYKVTVIATTLKRTH